MLRLLFTTQDKSKQLTVITDGIDSQLNVFVTENTVGDIDYFKSLGIMILPGHVYNIGTLKGWAFNNALILISYPEGLNEEAQILIDVTEEIRYTFTAKTSKLSFPNTGGDEEAVVTSYKQKYVNGKPSGSQTALEVTFETASPYSVSKGGTVTISENPTNQVRNGNLKVTQKESNKILNISLTQAASKVSYDYSLTVNPKELTFVNTGETKAFTVNSKKQKKLNGKDSGNPTDVGFSFVVNGTGFSKGSTEYSVVAAANSTTNQRTGKVVVTMSEGNKTATITLTQEAGASA